MQLLAPRFLPLVVLFSTVGTSALVQAEDNAAALTRPSLSERTALPIAPIQAVTTDGKWVAGPCLKDSRASPILTPEAVGAHFPPSPDSCTIACTGYKFVTLSFGYRCACSNTDPKQKSPVVDNSQCDLSCWESAPEVSCGGEEGALVYQLK